MPGSTPQRFLSKSRFKLGLECPTKLYYTGKPEYANTQSDDPLLQSLAADGNQVGELAKYYFPTGIDVVTLNSTQALAETQHLLAAENATVFEAAITIDDLIIRVDILEKTGNHFNLIEVKAKSVDPDKPGLMKKDNAGPTADWNPYLQDITFQHHVLSKAFPECTVSCYLMLVDKTAVATTDGLNTQINLAEQQKAHARSNPSEENSGGNNSGTDTSNAERPVIEPQLLTKINVDDVVTWINTNQRFNDRNFVKQIEFLSGIYKQNKRIQGALGKRCLSCEFNQSKNNPQPELLSGYRECWRGELNWNDDDFKKSTVLNVWNLSNADALMQAGKLLLDTIKTDDISLKDDDTPGLSSSQRQWMQIVKAREADTEPYIDIDGLSAEMNTWQYPLHFIDFETSAPALPFTKGMKPYQTVAFQFSHHVMHEDGRVEHIGEFLETTLGSFPNLAFVRELKHQLSKDTGTIFRFHNHENSVLAGILTQLLERSLTNATETKELCDFIKSITRSPSKVTPKWKGDRDMVDLHRLGLRYYYHPATKGSNTLKALLPALISSSQFIRHKYSHPIYGANDGIPSLNFSDHRWFEESNGVIKDPYALLLAPSDNASAPIDTPAANNNRIANGAAAMSAYGILQDPHLSDDDRALLNKGLLRYCELDTLAMVMVVEAWRDMLGY